MPLTDINEFGEKTVYEEFYVIMPVSVNCDGGGYTDLNAAIQGALTRLATDGQPDKSMYYILQAVRRVSLGARPPIVQEIKLPARMREAQES